MLLTDFPIDTKMIISQSYLELLKESTPEKITIIQIIEKAGVSRSTFYLHFMDKEDLITYISTNTVGQFFNLFGSKLYDGNNVESLKKNLDQNSQKVVQHFHDHHHFYRNQFNRNTFILYFSNHITKKLAETIEDEELVLFISKAVIGCIGKWIFDNDQPIHNITNSLTKIGIYILQLVQLNCDILTDNQNAIVSSYNNL